VVRFGSGIDSEVESLSIAAATAADRSYWSAGGFGVLKGVWQAAVASVYLAECFETVREPVVSAVEDPSAGAVVDSEHFAITQIPEAVEAG